MKGILEKQWNRKKLCDEVETERELTYLGDRVSADGECEAAVTAIRRCGWIKFMKCGKLLYGRSFPLRLKGFLYVSYVRSGILYGNEAWCLKKGRWEVYEGQRNSQ